MQRNVELLIFVAKVQHASKNDNEWFLLLCYTALQICIFFPRNTWKIKNNPQIMLGCHYENNCLLVLGELQTIAMSSPMRSLWKSLILGLWQEMAAGSEPKGLELSAPCASTGIKYLPLKCWCINSVHFLNDKVCQHASVIVLSSF